MSSFHNFNSADVLDNILLLHTWYRINISFWCHVPLPLSYNHVTFAIAMKTCLLFHSTPFTLTLSRTRRLHLYIFQSLLAGASYINACSYFCVYAYVYVHVCVYKDAIGQCFVPSYVILHRILWDRILNWIWSLLLHYD